MKVYNNNFVARLKSVAILTLSFLYVPLVSSAPHSGVYLGLFEGVNDDGIFAVYVDQDNSATVMGYDVVDKENHSDILGVLSS